MDGRKRPYDHSRLYNSCEKRIKRRLPRANSTEATAGCNKDRAWVRSHRTRPRATIPACPAR